MQASIIKMLGWLNHKGSKKIGYYVEREASADKQKIIHSRDLVLNQMQWYYFTNLEFCQSTATQTPVGTKIILAITFTT